MLKEVIKNIKFATDCSLAVVSTIKDEEISMAWSHMQKTIKKAKKNYAKQVKGAKQQFALTAKEVFRDHLAKRQAKNKFAKAKRKTLAKHVA